MTERRSSTRERLIQAAIQLFIAQGVTETTTKQIADLAEVNEVTLFRHFGNKHGLLLAVMEDPAALSQLETTLDQQANQIDGVSQALRDYANVHLQALEQIQEFVRSLIGEAAHYPVENKRALGRGVAQANRYTAQYLATVLRQERLQTRLSTDKLASLLNSLLLGYAVLEFSSEFNELWQNRESFVEGLVELFLFGAITAPETSLRSATTGAVASQLTAGAVATRAEPVVEDLPAALVHDILKRAKKLGVQEFAIAYTLFAAGLTPEELASLKRVNIVSDSTQSLIYLQEPSRQVPLNQTILGKRYGSPKNNSLARWLKSRKDVQPALFLNEGGRAIAPVEIRQRWQTLTEGLLTPEGHPPRVEQAAQTWCVEMLMRGMSPEQLGLLMGKSTQALQPFVRRARERMALEQATRLDQKSLSSNRTVSPALVDGSLSEAVPEV